MTTSIPSGLPLSPQGLSQPQNADLPSVGFSNFDRSASVPRFEEAMRNAGALHQVQHVQQPVQVAQLAPTGGATATDAVTPVGETTAADARARAAEGLDLNRPNATPDNSGTSILNGLEQLRSVFDKQHTSVASRIEGTTMDVSSMMALQADVVKYTVLVDVSSKLAGKSTQAMDSLMKGQ